MKLVAIDNSVLKSGHNVRGIGVHTKELIDGLVGSKHKDIKVEAVDFSTTNLSKYDLVHYPYFYTYLKTLPDKLPDNFVVTIHDLIYLLYPKHYPPGVRGKLRNINQRKKIKKAKRIITISETSKKDICRLLNISPNKVDVVHLAPKDSFKPVKDNKKLDEIKKKYNLPDKFVLFVVGGVNYNKNIPNLIKACKKANIPLVLVGKHIAQMDDFRNTLEMLQGPMDWYRFLFNRPHPELAHYEEVCNLIESKNIIRTGFVPDEDLNSVFSLATLYCQPSFYEGFGLSILEAMACETPVIASKTQALVEIGDNAMLTFDPHNINDMARKINQLSDDRKLQQELIQKGSVRVKDFIWKKTIAGTLNFYEKALTF